MSGPGLARWDSGEHAARPGGGSSGLRRIPAALLLALLAALAIAGPAQASASWNAGDPSPCGEQGTCTVYSSPGPWFMGAKRTQLLIFRGWPVRWTIVRQRGHLWVRCWGGKHTLKRPQDLYSVLTVKDLRTGHTAVVDCRSPQGLNWTYSVPVLKIRRQDAIEVWKTPTRPVVATQASASWPAGDPTWQWWHGPPPQPAYRIHCAHHTYLSPAPIHVPAHYRNNPRTTYWCIQHIPSFA